MDQHTLEQIESIREDFPQVDDLLQEHKDLDEKVAALSDKPYLSPEEDVQLHNMKKEKLRIKDEIEQLIQSQKSA